MLVLQEGDLQEIVLNMGELYVSDKEVILETLLGSCVATCLFDKKNKIGGMNHILLPGIIKENNAQEMIDQKDDKFGIFALDKLFNNMRNLGANREYLIAKVYGASYLYGNSSYFKIQEENVEFVKAYMDMTKIPIIENVTYLRHPIRIKLNTYTGQTWIRNIKKLS